MYGNHHHLRPYGGVPGFPPQYTINPGFYNQNPHLLTYPFSSSVPVNPYIHRPQNPYIPNPNFPFQQHPIPNTCPTSSNPVKIEQHPNTYPTSSNPVNTLDRIEPHPDANPTSSNPVKTLDRIESAVKNSHKNLLAIGDNITAWGVSQAALVYLQVDSWTSLGFQIHQVPSLNLLMTTEGRVNSFIHCFIRARRFASVYDLEIAICKNEGIEKFEGLKLGPLIKHPLVLHYFSVPSDVKQVHKITSEKIVDHLVEFIDSCEGKGIKQKRFLKFLASKEAVAESDRLGVRIPHLKIYVTYIQDASKAEGEILTSCAQALKQESIDPSRKAEDEVSKQPAITSKKKVLDKSSTKDGRKAKGETLKSSAQALKQKSVNHNKKAEDEDSKEPAITSKKKVLDKSSTKVGRKAEGETSKKKVLDKSSTKDAGKADGETLKSSAQAMKRKSVDYSRKVEDEVSKQPAITSKKKVVDKSSTKDASKAEEETLKSSAQALKQKSIDHNRKVVDEVSTRPAISSEKKVLDKFSTIPQHVKSFSPIPIHSGLGGKRLEDSRGNNDVNSMDSDLIISSYPFPSTSEEQNGGFGVEVNECSPSTDPLSCNPNNKSSDKKTRLRSPFTDESLSRPKRYKSDPRIIKNPDFPIATHNSRSFADHENLFQKNDVEKSHDAKIKSAVCGVGDDFGIFFEENAGERSPDAQMEMTDLSVVDNFNLVLTDDTVSKFINTWKDACQVHSVDEVFERMINFYNAPSLGKKKISVYALHCLRRQIKSLTSTYPCIGLLNVAIRSIKCGMWDNVYDTSQTMGQHGCMTSTFSSFTDWKRREAELLSKTDSLSVNGCSSQPEYSLTVDGILKKVGTYFEMNHCTKEADSPLEKLLICSRRLRDCEVWLTKQFSVKDFDTLGHGEFLKFLEANSSQLPCEMYGSFTGDLRKKSLLEVTMLGQQLILLLSQAASSLWVNHVIRKQHISFLLRKQFPTISLEISGDDLLEDLAEYLKKQERSNFSSCVLFSATLLRSCYSDAPSAYHLLEGTTGLKSDLGLNCGALGSVSSTDALKCLLRAPMLSDLLSWSHWDLIFGPSLGPLVDWLLNEVHTKELLCIVTRDGKIIRVDHSVTIDDFLVAALQGSSFETAVKLLSLISLYGGDKDVPMSLLRCHARQAIEVILKNSLNSAEDKNDWDLQIHGEVLRRKQVCSRQTEHSPLPPNPVGIISQIMASQDSSKGTFGVNKAISVVSRFILDFISYLPSEFCSFAADIFLSGFKSLTGAGPSAIIHECTQINQRMMLHDIGLSLGVVEWIGDYHTFCSSGANELLVSLVKSNNIVPFPGSNTNALDELKVLKNHDYSEAAIHHGEACIEKDLNKEASNEDMYDGFVRASSEYDDNDDAANVIESIRREEFGLIPSLSPAEMNMLKKQHARLGRALHCLSRELYSRDSHFLLELVQNADDNVYPESVEPTLVFIIQASGTAVLNNEQGFSAQNIKALCDVGNSTKGGSTAGYIGQKGIGFKSVFRVTDAPEIHSNGFHVKFDTSEGHIGFVLPTVVSPCDIDFYEKLIPGEVVDGTKDNNSSRCSGSSQWKTCIILPFKRKLKEGTDRSSILSVFSDLHPSLLLFLHRLQCIKLVNMFTNEYFVMRRESLGGGIIRVSQGKEKTSWFVASQKLDASVIRPDVQTTEIAIAFTLDESANAQYQPHLEQQPVFAFLPLRTYGLKFILQGDFVLPSSREEIDGDSAWNQWLLSEVPNLFVSAQRSFCAIPCFSERPGTALMSYMSYVPLVGEVHGSLSHLPLIIMSKLRASNCMLLEGHSEKEWVPPCKALRGWDEQARNLLPDRLLRQHLGLGYLDKDVVLSDSLANALGIQEYGPKILVDVMSSVCQQAEYGAMKSMGLEWFSSCLSSLYSMLVISSTVRVEFSDIFKRLTRIPFIPLSDGTYSSVAEGMIWLPSDDIGFEGLPGPDFCPCLYAKLRTVSPAFLSSPSEDKNSDTEMQVENCIRMLNRIGVRRLSAHDITKVHILPAITDDIPTKRDDILMTEYVSFLMLHLQSSCPRCCVEREHIISELRTKAFILTNHGYKRPHEIPVHFSKEYGNLVDVSKLLDDVESNWHEVDVIYLKHANVSTSPLFDLIKWREFFQELGITDFVKIIQVEKNEAGLPLNLTHNEIHISPGLVLKDWESAELVQLLITLSSQKNHGKCKYLLEVLDDMWDDCFASKVTGYCISKPNEDGIPFESSFIKSIHGVQWVVSSTDQELHYPKDLFIDCEAVRSILGDCAPYAVPQVKSRKLISDFGFKTQVALDDALRILHIWRRCKTPFKASITQMSKFYAFVWDAMIESSKGKIIEEFSSRPSIFVPYEAVSGHESMVKGMFLSRDDVYWHDPTGSVDLAKTLLLQYGLINGSNCHLINTLAQVYHGFRDFFVDECRVRKIPPFKNYIQILLQLSHVALPSQAANAVFRVFLKWADDLKSGLLGPVDVLYLKEFLQKKKNTVLPTVQAKWVSLHRKFGLVCWCDNEQLKKQFRKSDKICFLYFGELSKEEKKLLPEKISTFMQAIGVPSLSEVVTRVAVYEGVEDFTSKDLLVDRVLPFAQRYIYKSCPDKYLQLKQSGGENLSQLQIVVVKKLSYRYNLEGCKTASKKCLDCRCLLQENVLYIKQEADSHSIFLELSRLFYHGIPELHLANFLNMIASMAESGCTEEQIEFFVVNSQNISKLPDNEPIWCLSSLSSPKEDLEISQTACSSGMVNGKKHLKSKRKQVDSTCSPAQANRSSTSPSLIPPNESNVQKEGKPEVMTSYTDKHGIPIGVGFDWIILDDTVADMEASLQEPKAMEGLQLGGSKTENGGCSSSEVALTEKDGLPFSTPNEHQAAITGRLGEFVAFKYLVEKLGEEVVNWVNKETETGSPYDIVLGKDGNHREYIEVKATRSATKDWFNISPREWQFAVEKGERFSILHVALLDLNNTKVTVFKNPARLCQQGMLKLTVLMSTGYRKPNLVP
ncbi:hypothetical protein MKX01_003905 [Papaver californicum]|nr:hypothetical protein MKX01_003905 [Papaver californicum]